MKSKIGKSFWFDLPAVDDVDARSFYEGLFNWQFLRMDNSAVSDYWVIQAGDELIGGLRKSAAGQPSGATPVLYFTVDDLDTYAKRVRELGGTLVGSKTDLKNDRGSIQLFKDREKNLVGLWAPAEEKR